MSDTERAVADGSGAEVAAGPPHLVTTASTIVMGQLAWLRWIWLGTALLFAIGLAVLGAIDAVDELDESLWQGAGANWQRWVVLGAGVSTVPTFAPLFVSHGVTRRQLAASAVVTMLVLAVLGGLLILGGYLLEGLVFAVEDHPHVFQDGERLDGLLAHARLGAGATVVLAAYYVTGWLIGALHHRFRGEPGVMLLVPAILPAALVEVLLLGEAGTIAGGIDTSWAPPFAAGVVGSVVVITATATLAIRITRDLALRC